MSIALRSGEDTPPGSMYIPDSIKNFLVLKPMINTLAKESKELLKDKENETTWSKVFALFEKLDKAFNTREQVVESFMMFADIVHRSIQSDRSRLNGVSLGFLKKCVEVAGSEFNFNCFVAPVLRLTGKSNKVFVSRAMDTLETLCKHADPKCLLKSINDNVDSANKNVRLASYSIAVWRIRDNYGMFWPLIERGLKDPAQEVRSVCKGVVGAKTPLADTDNEIKKNPIASLTPRKNFKAGKDHEETKRTECEVIKIAKEHLSRKPIQQEFFERLNQLKKERHTFPEKKDDDLTPRRLDRYLNRFRHRPSGGPDSTIVAAKAPVQSLRNPVQDQPPTSATPGQTMEADREKLTESGKTCEISGDAQVSFVRETLLFKREMNSSEHKDASIIHEAIDTYIAQQEIGSGSIVCQEVIEDGVRASEDLLVQDSLLECPGLSCVEDDVLSDLSRSFAGIAIEPSRCGGDFNKEELNAVVQSLPFNCHDASLAKNDGCDDPARHGTDHHTGSMCHDPIDVPGGCGNKELCADRDISTDMSIEAGGTDGSKIGLHDTPVCNPDPEMDPSAIVELYGAQASEMENVSIAKGTETRIPVDEDLDGVLGTDPDALEYGDPDEVGDSVLLNDMIVDVGPVDKIGRSQGSLAAECRKTGDGNACNTVDDEGVQDVFCPESSKLSAHKLFDGNMFDSGEEEVGRGEAASKPVFGVSIKITSDIVCPNRFSLDSKQDTLLDNVPQDDQDRYSQLN